MAAFPKVKEFMTQQVVTVKPSATLSEVSKAIEERGLNGVPVVDGKNRLLGIITEYNLLGTQSHIHFPTLQKILGSLSVHGKDKGGFADRVKAVNSLTATDVMDPTPLTLGPDESFEAAAKLFYEHHRVNPVPVIDSEKRIVGIVSRCDVLRVFAGSNVQA